MAFIYKNNRKNDLYVVLKEGAGYADVIGKTYAECRSYVSFYGISIGGGCIKDQVSGLTYTEEGFYNAGYYSYDKPQLSDYGESVLERINFFKRYQEVEFRIVRDNISIGSYDGFEAMLNDANDDAIASPQTLFRALGYDCEEQGTYYTYKYRGEGGTESKVYKLANCHGYLKFVSIEDFSVAIKREYDCSLEIVPNIIGGKRVVNVALKSLVELPDGEGKGDLYVVADPDGCLLRDDNHNSIYNYALHQNHVLEHTGEKKEVNEKYISVYDGKNNGWVADRLVSKVDSYTDQYTVKYTDLTADEVEIVATMIGETLSLSAKECKACTHTILNRRNSPYGWKNESLLEICIRGQYQGYGSKVYEDFVKYYETGRNIAYISGLGKAWEYEQKLNAIIPVIRGKELDFTDNAVYFSTVHKSYHGDQVLINEDFKHMFFKHEEDK